MKKSLKNINKILLKIIKKLVLISISYEKNEKYFVEQTSESEVLTPLCPKFMTPPLPILRKNPKSVNTSLTRKSNSVFQYSSKSSKNKLVRKWAKFFNYLSIYPQFSTNLSRLQVLYHSSKNKKIPIIRGLFYLYFRQNEQTLYWLQPYDAHLPVS